MSNELKKASVGFRFLGGILLFLVIGLLVLIVSRLTAKPESLDDTRAHTRLDKLNVLNKENHAKLSTYAWVSKDKGVVQLPIERAEELVVPELKSKPVKASAVKVESPYPYGLQQPVAPPAAPAPAPGAAPAPGTPPAAAAPATTGSAAPAAPGAAAPQPAASPAPATTTAPK